MIANNNKEGAYPFFPKTRMFIYRYVDAVMIDGGISYIEGQLSLSEMPGVSNRSLKYSHNYIYKVVLFDAADVFH